MQRCWLLLVVGAISVSVGWAGAAEPGTVRPYASLEKLDPRARAAWIEEMLRRLDEANGVVLAPDAVAKQHARFREVLAPFADNTTNWRESVEFFDSELALSQRAAMEHLTRRYRMTAYRVVRTDRGAFDARRKSLEQVMAGWRNSDSPADEQYKVIRWLAAATPSADDGELGHLPPLPEFVVGGRLTASATTPEPAALPDAGLPFPTTSPQPIRSIPDVRPARFLADRIAASVDLNAVRPAAFHTPVSVDLPVEIARRAMAPAQIAMQPSFETMGFAAVLRPAPAASSARDAWRQPSSVAGVTRPYSTASPHVASRATSPSPSRSGDPFAFARTSVDRLTMVSRAGQSRDSDEGRGSRFTQSIPDSSASSAMARNTPAYGGYSEPYSGDLSEPDSASEDAPPALELASTPSRGTAPAATAVAKGGESRGASTPNLEELAARIRGNNVALRTLAARIYEERSWDAKSLGSILDQLAPLVARKDDLKLIRDLVPATQRQRVGELETGSELIADLGSKIARARNQVKQGEFRGSIGQRKAELDQLDQLSRKLAGLVFAE